MFYKFYTKNGQFVTRILNATATIYKVNSKEVPYKKITGDSQNNIENKVVDYINSFGEKSREPITEEEFNKITNELFQNKFS